MKDESRYIARLEQHDVKPTAMRILLLRTMMAHDDAFSLQSLEDELDTVDIEKTVTTPEKSSGNETAKKVQDHDAGQRI